MLSFKKQGRAIARLVPIKKEKGKKYSKNKFLYLGKNGEDEVKAPPNYKFQVVPNPNISEKVFIAGPSGSGKSYYAGKYIGEYKKIKKFKKDDVFIISNVDEDKALDEHKPKRIKLNSEVVQDPIHPSELENALIVFDDAERISNKLIRDAIHNLRSACLEESRHYGSRLIVITHQAMQGAKTRGLITEATSFTFFPKHSAIYFADRYMKVYIGLGKKTRNKILKLPSRWVTLYRGAGEFPAYCIYDKGAFIIQPDLNEM